jgi:hypothetical protein
MTDAGNLQRKLAWISHARCILYALMGIVVMAAFVAGIKHAAKAPIVPSAVLVLLFVLPVVFWLLAEYLGHLKGKYSRQLHDLLYPGK